MREWRFPAYKTLTIVGNNGNMERSSHTLCKLRGLQAPMCDALWLRGSICTAEQAQALAAELPAWSHMCVGLFVTTDLTHELLANVMPVSKHIKVGRASKSFHFAVVSLRGQQDTAFVCFASLADVRD